MYEPAEDSFLLQKYVKKLAKGSVLDMGTGSGIQAEEAAKSRKVNKVTALDIDEKAIIYCIKNQKSKKITYAQSNLFSMFITDGKPRNVKFDTIIFNAPYLPNDEENPDVALDGGKEGYELTVKFLKAAKTFLKPKGIILLIFSSFTGKEKVDKYLLDHRYKFTELEKIHISFEDIYCYRIENEA